MKACSQQKGLIQVYKKGLVKSPENIRLRMFLASAYEMEQDYKNALENYETLIEKRPNVDVAVNNLVSLLLDHFPSKENTAKAVKLAERFNNSEQPYFLDTYGWALLQDGKPKLALPVFEKVTKLKSNVAVFKYHLGLAYSQVKKNEKAVSALEEAWVAGAKSNRFVEKELTIQLLKEIKVLGENSYPFCSRISDVLTYLDHTQPCREVQTPINAFFPLASSLLTETRDHDKHLDEPPEEIDRRPDDTPRRASMSRFDGKPRRSTRSTKGVPSNRLEV